MRFKRYPRSTKQAITPRRLAAARKAIQAQREKAGLFAFALPPVTPEERVAQLDASRQAWLAAMRSSIAASWRASRRTLFRLPADQRRALLARWNRAPYPASDEYFAAFIRGHGIMATAPPPPDPPSKSVLPCPRNADTQHTADPAPL